LGDLYDLARVWWVPQIPMKAFHVSVANLAQAKLILKTLADYDRFQFENNVKPDYCNAGGLEVFRDGDWEEWESDDGDDIRAILRDGRPLGAFG
jgi:hypothetical protein